MGLVKSAFASIAPRAVRDQAAASSSSATLPGPRFQSSTPTNYQGFARGAYQANEIIATAIDLLATSAAEPHVIGRRKMKASQRDRLRNQLLALGLSEMRANYFAIKALQEDVRDHPAIDLLNRPNPFTSRFQFWATVIMHKQLAGNAFAWKRRQNVRVAGRRWEGEGEPEQLWMMRPDRVKIVPGAGFISHYEYRVAGEQPIEIPVQDVIHWKTRHPLDDYYGQPPLLPLMRRISIDNFMAEFVGAYFRNGGQPGAVLVTKQKLSQDAKDELRNKHRSDFVGPGGWFDLMVIDANEGTYSPMQMGLGARGLVVPELNAISESRLLMRFGIPASIAGALIGYDTSSYANQRQAWQVLWDVTLTPEYVDLGDTLNLSLQPDYPDLSEFLFDLSDVRALQEDVDKIHDRLRKDLQAGGITREEFRAATGRDPEADGGTYLLPANVLPTPAGSLDGMPTGARRAALALLRALLEPAAVLDAPAQLVEGPKIIADVHCPKCGKWRGRNMNVGATAYCRCGEFEVQEVSG